MTYTGNIDFKNLPIIEVRESDLIERNILQNFKILKENDYIKQISANWKPFEIKTFGLLIQ